MIFISMVVSVVSVVSILSVNRLANASAVITKSEIPKLSAVQEILSAIVSANLYSDAVLSESKNGEADKQKYRALFEESVLRAHLYLEALTWGSESDAFKETKNGELYRTWQDINQGGDAVIEKPSAELARLAGEANLYLTGYENNIHKALESYDSASSLESEGKGDEATQANTQAAFYENKATTNYLESINNTLEEIEKLSNTEVKKEVFIINSVTKKAQLTTIVTSTLGILVLLVLSSLLSHLLITRPIKSLTVAVESMAHGDLTKRVEVSSRDEIGRLAQAFNAMSDKLKTSYDTLEQKVQEKTVALTQMLEKFEVKNTELEKSQIATINLLEDLEEEKDAIEQKVKDRTREIEREKRKLLQVTGNMRGGAILLNEAKEVVFSNERAHRVLGVPPEDMSSEHLLTAFYKYFAAGEIKKQIERCFNQESFQISEIVGGERVYEIFFHYIQDTLENAEQTVGYFILFYDITDAKLLERSKSELVAVASHQLRTPLTAMRGNVEMLVDESYGPLNKEQHELLDDIEVSTIRLITMVNEMLDITKIERGNLEMTLERLGVKEIIDSVVDDLSSYAKRHEFEISLTGVPADLFINGDRLRVRQIFQNLIDNAIKYSSHPGKLEISANPKEAVAEIIFKDNGIGVPKNEQINLFGRFYRASNTAKTASSGSGLGLYIVKSIAKQLGGDIWFASEEGNGTTFFVELPLHK